MNANIANALLTPSDIATIAQVSRAAVSNWRRREGLNFPSQTGGSASRPLFDKQEVVDWLRSQGKDISEANSAEHAIWELMNTARGAGHPEEALALLYSIASLRVLSEDAGNDAWGTVLGDPTTDAVQHAIATQSEDVRDLANIDRVVLQSFEKHLPAFVRAIESIDRDDIAQAFDYAMERQSAANLHRAAGHGSVTSPAASLLTNLANQYTPEDGTLYDPASGISSVLIESLSSAPARIAVGVEIADDIARRARQRALLRGLGGRLTVHTQDILQKDPAPRLQADVAVVEAPAGIRAAVAPMDSRWPTVFSPSAAELAFVFDAIAHLKPTGRGFALVRANIGTNMIARDLRGTLLEKGHIETVVALPQKTVQWAQVPFHLWVLAPAGSTDEVTFIDATTDTTPTDVATNISTWLSGGGIAAPHARIGVATILADNATLAPSAWINYIGDEDATELYLAAQAEVAGAVESSDVLNEWSHSLELPALSESARVIPIKELIKLGWVEKVTTARAHRASHGDAENVIGHADLRAGAVSDLPSEHDAGLTLPGDVLVGIGDRHGTVVTDVDTVGGHLISSGMTDLRVKQLDYIDPYYLAVAITGSWNERHTNSSGPYPTAQVDHMDVPVPPIAVQRDIVALHQKTVAIRREAERLTAAADAALQGLLHSVRQTH